LSESRTRWSSTSAQSPDCVLLIAYTRLRYREVQFWCRVNLLITRVRGNRLMQWVATMFAGITRNARKFPKWDK
jgi:hypothetical protein